MANPPDEVVASPLTLYLAVVGTVPPAIDALPSTFDPAWSLFGTEGSSSYDESGVSVSHAETVNDFTPAGSTMPVKRFRTGESLQISLNLVDLGPEGYAMAMNNATVTTVAAATGTAGEKNFSLFRGDQVNSFALLARGVSSVDNSLNLQYEFSDAFVSVNGDVKWNKGVPAMLPVSIMVANRPSGFARIRIQTAAAL